MFRLVILILWVIIAPPLMAASNIELSYGGRLTTSNGSPVTGPVELEVKFFRSPTGVDVVPIVVPNFTNTQLVDGVFQIAILLTKTDFHIVFDGQTDTWLQVRDVSHNVTYPRQKFSPVPYALKIPVDGKMFTYNVDGELVINASGAGADKYLKMNATGDLVWSSITGTGVGDMVGSNNLSEVTVPATARTNLGLKGAAILDVGTTAGTVAAGNHTHTMGSVTDAGSLATRNTVGAAQIDNDAVNSSKIVDGSVTGAEGIGHSTAISRFFPDYRFDHGPMIIDHSRFSTITPRPSQRRASNSWILRM